MREKILTYLFTIASTLLFIVLFFYSITMTGYVPLDLSSELISFKQDNILWNGVWLLIVLGLCGGLFGIVRKQKHRIHTRPIAIAASLLAMAFSLYWVKEANVMPEADQWNISYYADVFNQGDYLGFQKGKYIATCPHQLGMVTLLRILYTLTKPYCYLAFRLISVASVGIIVYIGYELVRRFSKANAFTELIYLMLAVLCYPMYVYTLFIYGEVSSTAVLFIAALLVVSCLEDFHWAKVVGLLVCAGLSTQLRQNSLIVLIGFMVVIAVKLIQKFHWKRLVMLLVIPIGILLGDMTIKGIYKDQFQEDGQAIPTMLYITMGTNWEEQNPGWFSGYNYSVFFENDCDPEQATEVAKQDFKAFVSYCIENPSYAVKFYKEKFIAQWNEPMYHCLVMNCKIVEEQSPIMHSLYFGKLRIATEEFMNIYQLVIYTAILGWMLSDLYRYSKKGLQQIKQQGIEQQILMVGIFGGFLFSMIWEAKTRYIFPYFLMMMPYAALGIERMISHGYAIVDSHFNRKK